MAEEAVVVDVVVPAIPGLPIAVLFGEAVDALKFAEKRWQRVEGNPPIPGLKSGVDEAGRKLSMNELVLMRAALDEAQAAHTHWLLTAEGAAHAALRRRSTEVLSELITVLDYYLDDGIEDDNDTKFAQVNALHAETGESTDAQALALFDYAALAKPLQAKLHGLGEFDGAMIDEAPVLAEKLRGLPPVPSRQSPEAKAALADRNTKINRLYHHVRRIRAAARFVYRNHPEIAREASSAWERRVRAERARAKKATESAPS